MKQKTNDIIEGIFSVVYAFNYFGGGFLYAVLFGMNESQACVYAFVCMVISLYLYIVMESINGCIHDLNKRMDFNILILITILTPVLWRIFR